MMTRLPTIESYPKTVVLRDDTRVQLRLLEAGDKIALLEFFKRVPEDDRFYLKENVTSPGVIKEWTANINFERVIPVVALVGSDIVADATLHRSRSPARRHIGEVRLVVDQAYRDRGLGRRLIRELVDIAADLGLEKVIFELVEQRQKPAIMAAESMGFRQVATLKGWAKDLWGNTQDVTLLEFSLASKDLWWRF
jgi:L-amino acid N-acyltransferase YncA